MNMRNEIIRYAHQRLRYAAGGQRASRVPRVPGTGYFISHSPRIWHPLGVNIGSEVDPETDEPVNVAHISGILNSVRPKMSYGDMYDRSGRGNSHGGSSQRSTHILAPGAEVDDAHFQHSPRADSDTDLHEDEAHRYVAGQRAVREFIGLDPKQTAYMTPVLTSLDLAHEAARATGGFVHELQLNPRHFAKNNVPVLNARNGSAVLIGDGGASGPINNSETHLDISRQVHLANTYAGHTRADQTYGNEQAFKHLHLINQRHWPMLTQHHDALMTLPGAPHPHQALLGRTLRDHANLLAPSHESMMQASEPASTIYQTALKHPNEPVHRMALADTLDEQGHSDAADFFRSTLPTGQQKMSKRTAIVRYTKQKLRSSAEPQQPVLAPEIGFNVNDKHQAFTEQILSGDKTIETRSSPTLHPYVGKRLGLVRTGKGKAQVVGYVTIGKPKLYTSQKAFDAATDKHLVAPDSPFHITQSKSGTKWGYPLLDVEQVEPRNLVDGTGVAPNPRVARKLQKLRYSAEQQPQQPVPQPAPEPAPQPAEPQFKDYNHPDPHASPEKLEKIYNARGPSGASFVRNKMREWVGHDVPDNDIMDMLHVPRAHADQHSGKITHLYHPASMDGIVENGDSPDQMFLSCIRPQGGLYQKPYGYTATMTPSKDALGSPYTWMELIEHGGDPITGAKEFSMPHILYNNAMAMHRHGVKSIQADCALTPGKYIGAVTWPKYGFDAKLSKVFKTPKELASVYRKYRAHLAQYGEKPMGEHTLLDLLEHPQASAAWHAPTGKQTPIYKNARKYLGTFDTDPASRSMKMLRAQCEKIEGKYSQRPAGGTNNDSI